MSDLEIKPIGQSYIKELAQIHVESWRAGYKGFVEDSYLDNLSVTEYEKNWQSWIEKVQEGFIAYVDGSAAGFVSFGKVGTRPPGDKGLVPLYSSEIYALYVRPDYWRQGVGRALMDKAFERLKEQKHNGAVLWVIKKNTRAINFYERYGGQRIGKKKEQIGNRWLDESAIGWRFY